MCGGIESCLCVCACVLWAVSCTHFYSISYLAVILPFLLIVVIIWLIYGIVMDSIAKARSQLLNARICLKRLLYIFLLYGCGCCCCEVVLICASWWQLYLFDSLDTNMKPTWNDTVQRREFLLIFFLLHRFRTEAFLSPSITRSLYPIFKASMPTQHKNRFCHRTKSMACNVVLLRVHSNQPHHTDYDLCLVNWLSSPIANWVSPVTAHFG